MGRLTLGHEFLARLRITDEWGGYWLRRPREKVALEEAYIQQLPVGANHISQTLIVVALYRLDGTMKLSFSQAQTKGYEENKKCYTT